MKKSLLRAVSVILTVLMLTSSMSHMVTLAAEYRNGAQSGPSSSYKGGRYYSNYKRVPITGDNRTDIVAVALSQLGYQEGAANGYFSGEVSGRSNYVEFSYNMGDLGLGYGGSDYPWCASFVSWCLYQSRCTDQGTYKSLGRYHSGDYTYIWKEISCSQWVRQLKGAGYFKYSAYEGGSYTPKYGDLVYFQNSGGVAHIGICLYTSGGRIYTVEGNTSDSSGLEANGGGVYFKNYSLSSSYLYGYGVLSYKTNSSVPKIDYSGTNATPGLYVANAAKYVYTTETGSTYNYVLPRFSMFEVTEVCSNGRLKGNFTINGTSVTGYVKNNSDRVIQLSSTATDAVDAAKAELKEVMEDAMSILHTDYTEATILKIRAAYDNAQALVASSTATSANVKSAKDTLQSLLTQTGSNTIALNNSGIYINGRDTVIGAGDCHLFSPSYNNGLITVENSNMRYTLNVVVKWDEERSINYIKSKSYGTGNSTPSIQLEADEFLIACHDWETGISASNNPVAGSGANYKLLESMPVGTPVRLSGVSALSYLTEVEPAAFIKFMDAEGVFMTGRNTYVDNGKAVLFTSDFNGGTLTPANSNIHNTVNVIVEWNNAKGMWVVKDKFTGNTDAADSANTVTLSEGQALIAASDWQTGVTDSTLVYGSASNTQMLNNATVGQKVIFSGISPDSGATAMSCSANISFEDVIVSDEEDTPAVTNSNIALGKPQTLKYAASISDSSVKYGADLTDGAAATALTFDNNWFGFFNISNSAYTQCNTTNGVGTVVIDLQGKYNINSVKTHFMQGLDAENYGIGAPVEAAVYVSLDGEFYAYVGSLSLDPKADGAYWAELADANAVGRYVKLDVTCAPSWTFLNEIEVYGSEYVEPSDNNIALGQSYVGSAYAESPFTAKLTDGKAADTFVYGTNNAEWFGFKNTGDASTGNTTDGKGIVTIDLGGMCEITGFATNVQAGASGIDTAQFNFINSYYSTDGSFYPYINTFSPVSGQTAPYWQSYTIDEPVYARYIKFAYFVPDGALSLVNEIEVYGTRMTTAAEPKEGDMSIVSLTGDFNNWNPTPNMVVKDSRTVSATMELEAGTYEFKILYGNVWYGNNGTLQNTTITTSDIGWEMSNTANNCVFVATGGTYKFELDVTEMRLYVDYTPSANLPAGDNIALGKDYTAATLIDSDYNTSLTDDIISDTFQYGVNNSSWFAFSNTGDSTTSNTTSDGKGIVTVDLGGQCEVTGVSTYIYAGANDSGAVQPDCVNVYYSLDGVTYEHIKTLNPDTDASTPYWLAYSLEAPVTARYVKYAYFLSEGDTVLTNEIQVYGTQLTVDDADPGSMSTITLAGDFNNWNATPNMVNVDGTIVEAEMELAQGSYQFKLLVGSKWFGNEGVIEDTTETSSADGWDMIENTGNCTLNATGGMYRFSFNTLENKLVVSKATEATEDEATEDEPEVPEEPDVFYFRSSFNDWGTDYVLTDNGDGTYQITLSLAADTYEFKIATENYEKEYPLGSNMTVDVPRDADVTFILNTNDSTISISQYVTSYIVVFKDHTGKVIEEQTVKTGEAAIEPEAPERPNYRFTGWDKDTSCVTEDMVVTAKYILSSGTMKVEVSGGTGFTISVDGGKARPQGSSYLNTKMTVGKSVTVTASSTFSGEFMGWINPYNGTVLSENITYTFVTSGSDFIKAVYHNDIEDVNMVLFYSDKTKQHWDMQYYSAEDEIIFPELPECAGYKTTGWSMTEEEIKAELALGNDVKVIPVWEKIKVYHTVEVSGGTVTSFVEQNENGDYLENTRLTVEAQAPAEGMKFAYWINHNDKVKSYSTTYTMYPSEATTLTAVFVEENAEIEYQALASVDTYSNTESYGVFTISWNVPEEAMGAEYISAGIVAANMDNYNEDTFYHGTTDTNIYDRAGNTATTPAGTYLWTGPVFSGQTWVAKAWVCYYDANGEYCVVYSDLYTIVKE